MKKYFTINLVFCSITFVGILFPNLVFGQAQLIITPSQTLVCAGSCATLTTSFQGGGSFPGTYSWSPTSGLNSSTSANVTACPTSSTTYTCAFNATAGWNSQAVISINVNPAITLTTSVTNSVCGYNQGYIDLTVNGGAVPYTYHWNTNSTTQDMGPISVGTYSVTVTDGAGCTASTSASIIQIGNIPGLGYTQVKPTCGNSNGSTTVVVNPPNYPPYTYLWNSGATTQSITNLPAGYYNVTVTNSLGCTQTVTVTLTNSNGPFPSQITGHDAHCNIPSGYIIMSVGGGVSPYTKLWSNGATSSSIYNLDAGNYSVTITDAVGCSWAQMPVVIHNYYPVINLFNKINCTCGNDNGRINFNVTNEGVNPITAYWSWGQTTTYSSMTWFGLWVGNYSVTVTDNNGCSSSDNFTIIDSIGAVSTTDIVSNASCGNSDGSINLSVISGTSPYSFQWNNGNNSEDISGIPFGNYSVTVTDANNCTALASDTVNEYLPTSLSVFIQSGTQTFCVGGNVVLGVSPSGISYQWKKNNVAISGATNSTYTATLTGNYKCTITYSCGTVTTSGFQITRLATPSATITAAGATTFCVGQNVVLNVNVQSGVTYQWKKGSTALAGATNSSYLATTAGNYKCVVTKTLTGCTKTSNQIHITINCREEETISENNFSIYPNPFSYQFTLELKSISNISIYNLLGEKLVEIKNANGTVTLGEELSSGLYILEIKNEKGEISKNKIVKTE